MKSSGLGDAKYALYAVVAVVVALRVRYRLKRRAREGASGASGPSSTSTSVRHRTASAPCSDRMGGDVGLVARREVLERVKGRTFRIRHRSSSCWSWPPR